MITMEVCANSVASALAGQAGGASRIELCDNLSDGGTTPSFAQIKLARQLLHIPLYVLIRPRGGDFLYSDLEFEIMKEDVRQCVALNCDGVVFGMLLPDGQVDTKRCKELLAIAQSLPATFHRAFDMCANPFKALETIIELGFTRILTSGREASAPAGAALIKELITQAQGRINIMPGSGITEHNLKELLHTTGAREFHATAKSPVSSLMLFQNTRAEMGSKADEFRIELTDRNRVKLLVEIANSL